MPFVIMVVVIGGRSVGGDDDAAGTEGEQPEGRGQAQTSRCPPAAVSRIAIAHSSLLSSGRPPGTSAAREALRGIWGGKNETQRYRCIIFARPESLAGQGISRHAAGSGRPFAGGRGWRAPARAAGFGRARRTKPERKGGRVDLERMRHRPRGRNGLAIAVAAMLSACTLSPNTPEPKLDVPESFRASAAAPGAAWPSADWWRGFGAPELDTLMSAAEAANLDIAAAAARVQQADAQVRVAGAALLPSLDATAGYTRSHPSSGGGSGFSRSGGTTDIFNTALNASYEIDFWGKNRAAINAAKSSAIASRFDQET